MADVYVYMDETGDLGMTGGAGESLYFGIGTATFHGDHGAAMWAMADARFAMETRGLVLTRGFHAKDDSPRTRHDVFGRIAGLSPAPRFDFTMLEKSKAYATVKARGEVYLYKLAWWLHFKEVVYRISSPGDTVHVAAGTLGTAQRAALARRALRDVCDQLALSRSIHLSMWEARSSAGIQIADYGLWSVQRRFERADSTWYDQYVAPMASTCFRPW